MSDDFYLGPELEKIVADLVESGRYASRDEVVRQGVKLVIDREKRLARLDAAIERGIADAEAGRVSSVEEVEARLLERIAHRTAAE